MNDNIKRGFFRVLANAKWVPNRNPHDIHEDICKILEPYGLTIWDNEFFPITVSDATGLHDRGYYDIHVENELYGDQPVKDLMDKIVEVEGVKGIAFIDTSSVYCIPIFFTNARTPPLIFEVIKSSFVDETFFRYKHEKSISN